MVDWVENVETGFKKLASNKNALFDAHGDQIGRLKVLIKLVQGELTAPERQKIMCMITMDAHSRDIIENLANAKVNSVDDFQWQSQLKCYYD